MFLSKTFILGLGVATVASAFDITYIDDGDDLNQLAQLFDGEDPVDDGTTGADATDAVDDVIDIAEMQVKGYFKTEGYQAKTAEQKFNRLWTMITEDDTMQDYIWDNYKLFTNAKNGSFCQNSDEMRNKREKVSHRQGLVASFKWQPVNVEEHGYTGFYENVSTYNILRFSQTTNLTDRSEGLLPSVALKFMIDGLKSENLFGMPSFHETNSWDFFENDMKSRVEPFDEETDQCLIQTIQKKLIEGTNRPFSTGVSTIGDRFVDGRLRDDAGELLTRRNIKVPYELSYSSPFKDHSYDESIDERDWAARLQSIGKANEHILDVWAKEDINSEPVKIAEIILTSDLLTSKFGDERLHFQHVRTKKDRKFWSADLKAADKLVDPVFYTREIHDWDTSTFDAEGIGSEAFVEQVVSQSECPFAWLYESIYGENNTVVKEVIQDVIKD